MRKNLFQNPLSFVLSTLLLTSINVMAKDMEKKVNKLDSVTIVENESSNYLSKKKPSITRSNLAIENTAKSIQVFNEDFIEDFQLQNIEDIIKISSNTVYAGDTDGKAAKMIIRGFSNVPILLDNLKVTNKIRNPEVFNFESVEVLKGANSLQYGQSSPGGIVNYVTKKPLKESFGKLQLEINNNPSFNPKLDVGGSLNNNESLYFRLVSSYKYAKPWTNSSTNIKSMFLAPSLSYEINNNNKLTFLLEYSKEITPTAFGTNVNSKGELVAPIENTPSHPDEKYEKVQKLMGFDLHSNFDSWNSSLKYRYIDYERDYGNVYLPLFYDEITNTVTRFSADQISIFDENSLQYTLNSDFRILELANNFTIGVDYNKATFEGTSRIALKSPYKINLENPVYEDYIKPVTEYSSIVDMSSKKKYIKSWGVFLQDNIYLTDNLILNAGLRYSESKPQNSEKSDALTPSFGLVYKVTPQTSIYTNYSESFTPNSKRDKYGKILKPEEGKAYELGIKQKLFEDNLNLTAAIFNIEKKNIALNDPNDPFGNFSIASGKQKSEGFELDVVGNITDNWTLLTSYGYTNIKDENTDLDIRNVPKHTANIYTTYYLSSFNLANFYVGGGVRYIGTRYADDANSIKLDSQIIYNASLGYKKGKWKASLNIQNLSDEEYVNGSASGRTSDTRVYVGNPRTIIASISYRF